MTKICVDDLTIGQLKELTRIAGTNQALSEHPYQVGKAYFIRCVTFYYIGKLVRVTQQELVLEDCVWVADTGRFHQAITKGELSEVEPFGIGEVIIGRGAVVDASVWTRNIPTEQK